MAEGVRRAAEPCAICGCPEAGHPGFLMAGPCETYRNPDESPFEGPSSYEYVEKGIGFVDRWHERREARPAVQGRPEPPLPKPDYLTRGTPHPKPEPPAAWDREIESKIVKTRFGYHATTTHGPAHVGVTGLFSFTRRGIDRKVARLHRYLRKHDEAYDNARIVRG